GVLYSVGGSAALARVVEACGVPAAETQAGKGALPWDHPLQAGAIGVTGSTAANALAHDADAVIAIGTRLQDFTTGSHTLFPQARLVGINTNGFDARKWHATPVMGDAARTLDALLGRLAGWSADPDWTARATREARIWRETVSHIVDVRDRAPPALPYEGEVIGAVQRHPR